MRMSRKQEREFKQLKADTEELLRNQREVLENAGHIARDAGRQAAKFSRDEVAPRIRDGFSAARAALAALEAARQPEVRAAIARVTKGTRSLGAKAGVVEEKSSGPGRYILLGLGLVVVAGIAYAAWQTLRADDSLWIEDDPDQSAQ